MIFSNFTLGSSFFESMHIKTVYMYTSITVLSVSFKVDVPTGKVGGSLLFERQRRELPRGVWGHAPLENFEI